MTQLIFSLSVFSTHHHHHHQHQKINLYFAFWCLCTCEFNQFSMSVHWLNRSSCQANNLYLEQNAKRRVLNACHYRIKAKKQFKFIKTKSICIDFVSTFNYQDLADFKNVKRWEKNWVHFIFNTESLISAITNKSTMFRSFK